VLVTRALRDKWNAINSFYCSKVLSYDAKSETLRFTSSDLNPYIGYDESTQKQHMASLYPNMRIKKVGVAKVVDGGSRADCKMVQGMLEKGQTYFVTDYDFPFNDVTEVSNHYFVRKQDH
jgi:hypothetical protein